MKTDNIINPRSRILNWHKIFIETILKDWNVIFLCHMLPNFPPVFQYRLVFHLALIHNFPIEILFLNVDTKNTTWNNCKNTVPCFHSLKRENGMLKKCDTIPKSDIRSNSLSNSQKTLLVPQKTSKNFIVRYTTENTIIRQQTIIAHQRRSYHDRSHRALNIKSPATPSTHCANSCDWLDVEGRVESTNNAYFLLEANSNGAQTVFCFW